MADKFLYTGSILKDRRNVYDDILQDKATPKNPVKETGIYTGDVLKDKQPSREISGAGYLGGSLGVGIASPFEGITDLITASAAWITGDKDYAEYIYKNNVTGGWQNALDDKYQPGKGMQTAGEIAGGVGQAISYIAMTVLTSGIASGAAGGSAAASSAAAKVGTAIAKNAPIFLSATGSATGEAVQTTGELGGKEMIYGAAVGTMETGLEKLSAVGGIVGRATGKTGAMDKAFSKVVKNTVARGILSDAAGEFAEEAIAEQGSTWLKRWTGVDPEARTSAGQVLRAGLIGAASGAILGGMEAGTRAAVFSNTGAKLKKKGSAEGTIKTAQLLVDNVGRLTYDGVNQDILDLKQSLESYAKSPSNAKLGEIASQMYIIETKSVIHAERAKILANLSEDTVTKVNALVPKPNGVWTMEDIRTNNGNIATIYATAVYANKLSQMTGDNSTTAQAIESVVVNDMGRVEQDEAATVEAINTLGADGNPNFVAYKMPIGTTVAVKTKDGYRVGVYPDRNSSNAEWSGITYKTAQEAYGALKTMDGVSAAKTENKPSTTADEGERAQQERKPNPQHIGTPKKPTRKQIKKAKQKAKAEAKAEAEKKAEAEQKAKEDAEEKAKISEEAFGDRKYTAEDMKLCREVVDDFDFLPLETQDKLLTTARTGRQAGANEQQIKEAIAFSHQAKTTIAFSDVIKADGMFTGVDNDYVIVISPKDSRTATVIHEMAHRMKKTKGWNAIAKYVRTVIGEEQFKVFRDNYEKSYKKWQAGLAKQGITVDDLTAEELDEDAIADAVAYYLKKVPYLENKARKGFIQKAYASIVSIVKMIKNDGFATYKTAIRIQRAYEKMLTIVERDQALREARKIEAEDDKRYSSSPADVSESDEYSEYSQPITEEDVDILRTIGRKSINSFSSAEIKKAQKWAYKFYQELGVKSPFFRAWFGEWRAYDYTPIKIAIIPKYVASNEARKANRGMVRNLDTATINSRGWEIRISRNGETNTISHAGEQRLSEYGLSGIRELIESAVLFDSEVHEHHANNAPNEKISFDHKLYALGLSEDGTIGLYKITVEEYYQSKNEPMNKRFHNLRYIEKIAENIGGRTFGKDRSGGSTNDISAMYSISDLYALVKQYDKDFVSAPDVSKYLLNDDGTPKVFYHGTGEKFTEFRQEEMSSVEGSYFFAENREDAAGYGKNVMEVYLSARNLANYDDQPSEFYALRNKRKQVEWLKQRGYDGWYADIDSGGWAEISVFSPEQIKSATDNIGTFDSSTADIRYSPSSSRDTTYLEAVNRGDKLTQEKLVRKEARESGYDTPMLYHGTGSFGFTRFRDGFIYATASQGVAMGYNRGKGLGKVRRAYQKYIDNDGTAATAIKNAQNVLGATLTELSDATRDKIVAKTNGMLKDVADKVSTLENGIDYEKAGKFWEYLSSKYGEDAAMQWENAYSGLAYLLSMEYTAEELLEDGGWFKHDMETYHEKKQKVAELFEEEREAIKEASLMDMFRYLLGYEYGDTLIDIEYGFARLLDSREKLVNQNGSLLFLEDVIDAIEEQKDVGIYELYGNPGEKPLVIDEGERFWDAIPFQGKYYSTDYIAKWAKENGYTSVLFKTVLDPSSGGSANVYADEYVFFNPNQVKSADPVTYDDNGDIIPLSKRFDASNPDIRYSPQQSASAPDPNNPFDHVDTTMPKKEKLTLAQARAAMKDFLESAQVELTNQQAAIENFLVRRGKMKRAEAASWVQAVRTSEGYGIGAVTTGQYSADGKRVGDGLFQILSPLWDKKNGTWNEKLYHEFAVYITNLHNIDRQREDKPVIPYTNEEITEKVNKLKSQLKDALLQAEAEGKSEREKAEIEADFTKQIRDIERPYATEMSQKAVEQYERQHPEFKAIAEQLSTFNRNLNQYRVDTGLLSQEVADELNTKYPHYVPSYRVEDGMVIGTGSLKGKYNFEVQQSVKTAKGSDKTVDNPILTYIHQTISTYKAGRVNQLLKLLHDNADGEFVVTSEHTAPKTEAEMDDETGATEYGKAIDRTTNSLTYWDNGKKVTIKAHKNIFAGFEGFTTTNTSAISSMIVKGFAKVNNLFKAAVTSWNPFFLATNFFKDTGDALFYSKFGAKAWAGARVRAQKMIHENHPLWQEYISMGGLQSSIYDFEQGFSGNLDDRGMLRKAKMHQDLQQRVENVNIIIEQASRFTEYVLSRESGLSVRESMLNAADVTINFSRGGRLVKVANKTFMPFLNPAVQGMSKIGRTFFEDRTKGDIISLVLKCVALGILPMMLANLMYGNDEEYDDLQDTVKENNYLFRFGDTWIKIPKGRVQAVLSGAYNRTERALSGKSVDVMDYLSNVASQATPLSNISRTIISPFKDVQTNTTWYGGTIETQGDQLKAPKDRYDEYTSELSKGLAKVIPGTSPKKWDYFIDQTTGVIGDILLPATTANSNALQAFGKMGTNRFIVNTATSSRISSEFYDIYEKTTYKKSAGDEEAYFIYKYLSEYKDAATELYDQIDEIQVDETLSTADKNAQSKALRVFINQTYKSAITDLETYKSALSAAMQGVKGAFSVVEITQDNRRQYDCEKDDIGRYAVIYNDQKYRMCDSLEEADKYVSNMGNRMIYAESIRLVYGAERAIKSFNASLYEKAQALNSLGIGYEIYYNAYFGTNGMTKKETEQYIASLGLSKSQRNVLMYALGYSSYKKQAEKEIEDKSIKETLNLSKGE